MGYSEYLAGSDLRASDLIGSTVRGRDDQDLGQIEELVVSRDDDVVTAVLSVGGILGIGAKRVAVPYEDLRISPDGESLYLSMTVDELEARPAFEYERGLRSAVPAGRSGVVSQPRANDERVSEPLAAQTDRRVDPNDTPFNESGEAGAVNDVHEPTSHANLERAERASADARSSGRSANVNPATEARNVTTMDHDASRASDIIGTNVTDSRGETLGEIDDLVISSAGRIEAVVAVGGILGFGQRLIAIPVDDLMIESVVSNSGDDREVRVRIATTAQQLIDAHPEFRYESPQAANVP